jgi:hypothetical protein
LFLYTEIGCDDRIEERMYGTLVPEYQEEGQGTTKFGFPDLKFLPL